MKKANKNKKAEQRLKEMKAMKLDDSIEDLQDIEEIRNNIFLTKERIKAVEDELSKFEKKSLFTQGRSLVIRII